uniref:Bifunctional inhibitor/plant lipid transfer protein/seed storage helical domain-containing protein n=1 Tax=Leersia perrieri TaxID=77586 RepID=A0A0D9XI44_9ORYZ
MASSVKLVVAVVLAVAMMMAATATAAYDAEPVEDCQTQTTYFSNCLGRGITEGCCGVVKEPGCLCQIKREAEVHCIPHRRCVVPKRLRIADMDLPCMRNLKCGKHA